MIEPSQIADLLKKSFPDGQFQINDLTGTKDHFEGVIISGVFEGKNRVEQHRLVYAALGDAMKSQIHAFTFKTYTPQDWANAQKK